MKIKYYTAEYLRDNFEFPSKNTQEELFWKEYDKWVTEWYNSIQVTYKPFKGIDY